MYNPANNSWRTLSPLPVAGFALMAGAVNGVINVVGGYGVGGTYLNHTQVYTP